MQTADYITTIVGDIYGLNSPVISEPRRKQIVDFVTSSINGDSPKDHLAITASLGEDKKGVIVYILTNVRLIKIDIDPQEVSSSSYPLDTVTNVERKLLDEGRAQVRVNFQNDSFGLRYSAAAQNITDFFLKIDQIRTQGRN